MPPVQNLLVTTAVEHAEWQGGEAQKQQLRSRRGRSRKLLWISRAAIKIECGGVKLKLVPKKQDNTCMGIYAVLSSMTFESGMRKSSLATQAA